MGNSKEQADTELFDMLRATGLRKKVARAVSSSMTQAKGGQPSDIFPREVAHKTVRGLRTAAAAIEKRVPDDSTAHASKAASSGRMKKRSAGRKRAQSAAGGSAKKASAPTRTAKKRPTVTKSGQRRTATRNPPTRARTSQ